MADWDNRKPHPTPTKAKVRGVAEYLEAKGIEHAKEDIFRHFGVSHRQGWAMLSEGSVDRRHHNREDIEKDHRGRKPQLTSEDVRKMDRLIQSEGFEARKLSWEELGWECGLEGISGRTIKKYMGTMDYHKCIACTKQWVNDRLLSEGSGWMLGERNLSKIA